MGIPTRDEDVALHARILQRESVANVDAFAVFVDPLIAAVKYARGCTHEMARDAAIDVLLDYLEAPERFDPQRGRLFSYLAQSAKNTVTDWQRSATRRQAREEKFGLLFELMGRSPKECLEQSAEVKRVVERIEQSDLSQVDRAFLGLMLQGERSTQRFAEVLGLGALPAVDIQREVKRNRDRILKWLVRFGREVFGDES
ncbi:sigma-70 family RNA polymerase sigma factor [Myxococcus xanthus]|uniref:Sigma-70 family RNA polymerase sigma factor n=1 Tax=Myxococcus xanthus TaxID=34 RepID=A0A7Y4IF01_MYXXA|nr:sigma-70 family RNA polymerase sigma factor [Myxococcus xanthus]NOJ78078.1 sigma-70 family RNA polymerase sigma factor [Myxococcus xanthus]NOJ84475.1 sigma-70 family RNA polymerase sigma factor [Myxococcus xanthus]